MKKIVYLIVIAVVILSSCDEKENGPLVDGFGAPDAVRNVKVENLPGAAQINYTLPSNPGMLYVEAEFMDDRGKMKRVKSSAFKNHLLLEGFGTAKEYEVNLYSVSKSEERSSPVQVTVNPTTPPVYLSAATLETVRAFGGLAFKFKNDFRMEYVFHTLVKDEEGTWTEHDRYYSGAETQNVTFNVRNLKAEPTDFAFFLQDKWGNYSDTIYQNITPLYEEELDKSLWKDAALMDDFNEPLYSPLYQLWTPGEKTYFFQDHRDYPEKTGMPTWVTIDLGKEYILGRMNTQMVQHAASWKFGSCTPRNFEIWASNEASTDWNKWDFIGKFEMARPSGRAVGEPLTDDDEKIIKDGHDFDFELSDQSYRYIRYKVLNTWGNLQYFCLLELTLWGQAID